jgi:hypothetical protein
MPATARGENGAIAPRSPSGWSERSAAALGASESATTIIIYSYDQAVAALSAAAAMAQPVRLKSPFCVAASLGPRVAKAMFEQASIAVPQARAKWLIDCGDAPGLALAALRAGATEIEADLPADAHGRVADIGRQLGAIVVRRAEEKSALDLADVADPLQNCRKWLDNRGESRRNGTKCQVVRTG